MAINNTTVHDSSVRYYFLSINLPVEELAKIIRNTLANREQSTLGIRYVLL